MGSTIHWKTIRPAPVPGCVVCTGSFNEIDDLREYLNQVKPSVFMYNTEACTGESIAESPPNKGVDIGNWNRGTQYGEDIIGDIKHGVSGWTDWNLLLNTHGGPNHVKLYFKFISWNKLFKI